MPRLFSAKVVFFILLLAALDMSVFPAFSSGYGGPVLLYLFVIYVAFEWHWTKTVVAAVMVGLVRDSLTIQPFGIETISLFLSSLGLNFYIQKVENRSTGARLIGTFLFTASVLLGVVTWTHLLKPSIELTSQTFWTCFFSVTMTTLSMVPFFWISNRWFQRKDAYRSI